MKNVEQDQAAHMTFTYSLTLKSYEQADLALHSLENKPMDANGSITVNPFSDI